MPANDVFELSVDSVYNNQSVTNVMHLIQVGADGSGDARDAVLGTWAAQFQAQQALCQVDSVQHFRNRCRRILPTQTQTKIESDVTVGGQAFPGLPTNQCAILRFYGAIAGRKGVGHQKMYGVGINFCQQGRLSTAWRDLCQTYGTQFKSDHAHISGYVFRMSVLGNDGVARKIQGTDPLPRIKQVHSRSAGVGL